MAARPAAAEQWRARVAAAHRLDPRVPAELPGYFADRFALGELRTPLRLRRAPYPDYDPVAIADRAGVLRATIRPTRALDGWQPEPDARTELSGFYGELRERWAAFATQHALPSGLRALDDARDRTWQEVFDASVFFPRPPVLSGPNFLDELGPRQRDALSATFGARAPIDFFCLMQQVHETVHRHQTGEPLLNEVIQACLWARFLDEHELWAFQRDDETGRSLVRELDLARRHPWVVEAAAAAGLDTAAMIDAVSAPAAYFLCCVWAQRFDRGAFRYAGYLAGLDAVLARRGDQRWLVRGVRSALARRPRPLERR